MPLKVMILTHFAEEIERRCLKALERKRKQEEDGARWKAKKEIRPKRRPEPLRELAQKLLKQGSRGMFRAGLSNLERH